MPCLFANAISCFRPFPSVSSFRLSLLFLCPFSFSVPFPLRLFPPNCIRVFLIPLCLFPLSIPFPPCPFPLSVYFSRIIFGYFSPFSIHFPLRPFPLSVHSPRIIFGYPFPPGYIRLSLFFLCPFPFSVYSPRIAFGYFSSFSVPFPSPSIPPELYSGIPFPLVIFVCPSPFSVPFPLRLFPPNCIRVSLPNHSRCISLLFFNKPQQTALNGAAIFVVYLFSSSTSHNPEFGIYIGILLYISSLLQQATTESKVYNGLGGCISLLFFNKPQPTWIVK